MDKKKKLGNKGFSLVELIIVIAIMVILVGVLAPQYIKYLDKSRIAADTQLADNIRQAMTTTLLDPNIETSKPSETDATSKPLGKASTGTDAEKAADYWYNVYEILGVKESADLVKILKYDNTTGNADAGKNVSITYTTDKNKITLKISGGKYTGANEITIN